MGDYDSGGWSEDDHRRFAYWWIDELSKQADAFEARIKELELRLASIRESLLLSIEREKALERRSEKLIELFGENSTAARILRGKPLRGEGA